MGVNEFELFWHPIAVNVQMIVYLCIVVCLG
jgi:hypothetical protein